MSVGKIQVVVRSRRVPSSVVEVRRPHMSYAGVWVGADNERSVVYESELDEEHRRAIEEGRRLADQLGLTLEVVDESRSNVAKKLLSKLGWNPRSPKLVITPSYSSMPGGACSGSRSLSTAR